MKKIVIFTGALILLLIVVVFAVVPTTIEDFFLPGSQVGQSGNIETPDRCDNCHGGYSPAVEPAFNWRGSMMSQAARDPLFYACLAIANQDAPDVGDMCLRCHAPDGWLNGRCVPTDGSALNNNDRQGVQCDFCHKMVKPTPLGVNPFPGNTLYTSTAYGTGTYTQDQSYLSILNPIPLSSANGMYIADANNAKRGPFSDAVGRHQMFYSPFHSQSEHCGTCHDVSNPAFTRNNTTEANYTPNEFGQPSPTFDLRLMFPVERTFSEWSVSDFADPTSSVMTCQDCHMKDVTGKGAKMRDAPTRTNLPLHDMTGGNTFVPKLVKIQSASEIDSAALNAGMLRARSTLQSAASLELTVNDSKTTATVKVTNKTGHKLPTGYPEGRRMWINVKAYGADNNLIYESGDYDYETAELNKIGTKIYECKPGLSEDVAPLFGEDPGPSFHFAVNNVIYFDNRIPPKGCTNSELEQIQSPVVGANYADNQHWDITIYTFPSQASKVVANLYYQTTSKEYVTFLRDENNTNSKGDELYALWEANGKSAPELMASGAWPPPPLAAQILSVTRNTSKQGDWAVALVSVTSEGTPVEGALVKVSYTGPNSGSVQGYTNTSGQVSFSTPKKKNPSGTWCFTLTSVTKSGYSPPNNLPITLCEGQKTSPAEGGKLIQKNSLSVNPNPASQKASITYTVSGETPVNVTVYDNTGRMVSVITDRRIDAGTYSCLWDVSALPEGLYYVILQADGTRLTKKLLVAR